MKLRVLFSRAELGAVSRELGRAETRKAVWIVIDVLRATTTIVSAFEAGCKAIHPTVSIAQARRLRGAKRKTGRLLAGERGGQPIRGSDIGNSPRDFVSERIGGREIVLTTENGTRTMQAAVESGAKEIWAASFANAKTVARQAALESRKKEGQVNIVCSGKDARFCLEDAVCAGMIVQETPGREKKTGLELTDSALACWNLYQRHGKNLLKMMRESSWGRHLENLGLGPDLEFCARANWSKTVPVFSKGVIRPRK
jgi:2-phosphosulfolactate phosphatase